MKLGKVVGTVVSTQKDDKVEGLKLYLVRDLTLELGEKSSFVVAADAVGAGLGELVLYASGSSARQTDQTNNRPIDATIMGIVDQIAIEGSVVYSKFGIGDEG